MANVKVCDACGKPITHVVLKLYLAPKPENGSKQFDHNAYANYADIGPCCAERLTRAVRWQSRKRKPRKNAPAGSVVKKK